MTERRQFGYRDLSQWVQRGRVPGARIEITASGPVQAVTLVLKDGRHLTGRSFNREHGLEYAADIVCQRALATRPAA